MIHMKIKYTYKDNKRYRMVETNLISFKVYKQQAGAVQIETSDSHDLCFVDMV